MNPRTQAWCKNCENLQEIRSLSREGVLPQSTGIAVRAVLECGHKGRYVMTEANIGAVRQPKAI